VAKKISAELAHPAIAEAVLAESDPLLTGTQAAYRLGIEPATWRSYVARGYAPKPDVPDKHAPANRSNPRWLTSAVDRFAEHRAGQGTRTDLAKEPS
jgi:hypothetical protein